MDYNLSVLARKIDRFCDYIPLVSTCTNLFHLCAKCSFAFQKPPETNFYYQHVQPKSYTRCVLLCIPFLGNLVFTFYRLRKNKKVMGTLIELKPELFLPIAHEKIKNCKEIVEPILLSASENNPKIWEHAGKALKTDVDFILHVLKKGHGSILKYIPAEYTDNADFMLKAIENYPTAIWHASKNLTDNADFMLKAIEKIKATSMAQFIDVIAQASKNLKENPDFMSKAIWNTKLLERYTNEKFKDNADFMLKMVKMELSTLADASKNLKNNANFMLEAVKIHPKAIEFASPELLNNEDFWINAVKIHPFIAEVALNHAGPDIEYNRNFTFALDKVSKKRPDFTPLNKAQSRFSRR